MCSGNPRREGLVQGEERDRVLRINHEWAYSGHAPGEGAGLLTAHRVPAHGVEVRTTVVEQKLMLWAPDMSLKQRHQVVAVDHPADTQIGDKVRVVGRKSWSQCVLWHPPGPERGKMTPQNIHAYSQGGTLVGRGKIIKTFIVKWQAEDCINACAPKGRCGSNHRWSQKPRVPISQIRILFWVVLSPWKEIL